MFGRLARSVVASVLACLAGIALMMFAFQALSGEWSLHNTLDLGVTLLVLAIVSSVVTCLPIFALLGSSTVLSTRNGAALIGAGSASLTGVVAVSWFFADGIYPQHIGDWLRAFVSPFFVPFPIAGAAFGYAWSSRQYSHSPLLRTR